MKTITFYSYKGGVGRSLTLSNIAMRLASLGKKVCLIDFDLEAPGLHLKFSEYLDIKNVKKGVVEYITEFQKDNFLPRNFDDYLIDINYESKLGGSIKFFSAGNLNSNHYWKNLSSINWKDLFYSEKSHGIELLLNLKEKIKHDYNPDFLLIDSRTGITDISGIAMTLLSDTVVTLAANNKENLSGLSRVIKSLKSEENDLTGNLPEVYFVLSRIPYFSKPEEKHKEVRLINKAKNIINKNDELITKVFVIHSDPELEEEEQFKINRYSSHKKQDIVPIEEDYLLLFEELTKGQLNDAQIEKFNKIRESEYLIQEAINSRDNAIKINKLTSAVKLDNESHEAYSLIAETYIELESYDEALFNIKKAINLNKDEKSYKHIEAQVYLLSNQLAKAKKYLHKLLKNNPNDEDALYMITHTYLDDKEYETALKYCEKLLKILPDYSSVLNLMANIYIGIGEYNIAFKYVYKALEINPKSILATGTLAELNLYNKNYDEFYKNLQLAFVFGMTSKNFQEVINEEEIYKEMYNDEKFNSILDNYRIKVKFPKD